MGSIVVNESNAYYMHFTSTSQAFYKNLQGFYTRFGTPKSSGFVFFSVPQVRYRVATHLGQSLKCFEKNR